MHMLSIVRVHDTTPHMHTACIYTQRANERGEGEMKRGERKEDIT